MATTTTPPDPPDPNAPPPPVAIAAPAPLPPPPPDPELDDDDRLAGIQAGLPVPAPQVPTLAVPRAAFKNVKERAVARGRAEAEREMLTTLGVESIAAAAELVRKSKEITMPDLIVPAIPAPAVVPPAPAPAPAPVVVAPVVAPPVVAPVVVPAPVIAPPTETPVPEATRRVLRERQEAADRLAASEKARADALVLENAKILKEREIREGMISDGVADVDYVFVQLQKHLATIKDDAAALAAFDRAKWTTDLKAAKPYLFKIASAPATNGPAAGAPAAGAPAAGTVIAAAAAAGAVDVRTMTDAQRKVHYANSGIKIPQGSRVKPTASR